RRTFATPREIIFKRRRRPAARIEVSREARDRSALQGLRSLSRILSRRQRSRRWRFPSNRLDWTRGKAPSAENIGGENCRRYQANQAAVRLPHHLTFLRFLRPRILQRDGAVEH